MISGATISERITDDNGYVNEEFLEDLLNIYVELTEHNKIIKSKEEHGIKS